MSRRNAHINFATNASTSSRVVFIRVKLPPPSSSSVFLISSWKVMILARNYSVISTYSNWYRFSIPTVSNAVTTEPISSVSTWIACISILILTNIHRYTRRKVSWLTIMWTTVRRNGQHWLSMMFSKMSWHQNSRNPAFRTMILSVTKVSFRWASTSWISRGSYPCLTTGENHAKTTTVPTDSFLYESNAHDTETPTSCFRWSIVGRTKHTRRKSTLLPGTQGERFKS